MLDYLQSVKKVELKPNPFLKKDRATGRPRSQPSVRAAHEAEAAGNGPQRSKRGGSPQHNGWQGQPFARLTPLGKASLVGAALIGNSPAAHFSLTIPDPRL